MIHLYVFGSTNNRDKCSNVLIFARTEEQAVRLINKKFLIWGYKGKPKRLAV